MNEEDSVIAIKLYVLRKENDGLLEALKCEQIERQKFIDENIKLKEQIKELETERDLNQEEAIGLNNYIMDLEEQLNNSIPVKKIEEKIKYLDNQQKQWLEDRELKASDSEIIFARDFLQQLIKENTESEE